MERINSTDCVRMLRVHSGLFLSMGVGGWNRFAEAGCLLADNPDCAHGIMDLQAEFSAKVAGRILEDVEVNVAIFSEPIGGSDRPLISPDMWEEFSPRSYAPAFDVLKQHGVETIILRTYTNVKILLPRAIEYGSNCLWISEVDNPDMDYGALRREFGRDLRLIGGINLSALRNDRESIRREIERNVPTLVADGGFVPLAGGRIREDVSFENFVYYRELLEAMTGGRCG